MFDKHNIIVFGILLCPCEERAIIKDIAILVDLNECSSFMLMGTLEHGLLVLRVAVE